MVLENDIDIQKNQGQSQTGNALAIDHHIPS